MRTPTTGLHSVELACGPRGKKLGITSQAAQKPTLLRLSHEYQSAGIFLRVLTSAIQIRVSPLHRTELTPSYQSVQLEARIHSVQ